MTPEVMLLAHTPDPTRVMALAARLCYTQGISINGLNEKLTDEACEKLVLKILSNKHSGVLEHPVFTFGVEGVSRDFSHQMVRHRNTSYDQQSLHYTLAPDGFDMAVPPGMTIVEREAWDKARNSAWTVYKALVARGVPREEARHILPSGIETKLLMTANLRQWMRFVELRACPVNCQEILVVAMKVKNYLVELMPYLKGHVGPPCIAGNCFEGKRYCGSPWVVPCRVTGDGLDKQINTRDEASWDPLASPVVKAVSC